MYMILLMITFIPLIFMFLTHPVSLSIMILLQAMMIALTCGLISNKFWFSYVLFLVMVGGLLVLFLYMTNVASNEKFKPSKYVKILIIMFFFSSLMMMFIDKFYSFSINSFWFLEYKNQLMEIILMKFFNYPSMKTMILMMIYLLLTMIMTVKMTNIKKGALRQKF